MAKLSEFVSHVVEMMRTFGEVQAKPMFGGWGLYHDGVFFALVAEDTLYLKCDGLNLERFQSAGLQPFVFESKVGERIVTSYRQAPGEALENAQEMATWAREGYAAALRSAKQRAPGRPRPRRTEA